MTILFLLLALAAVTWLLRAFGPEQSRLVQAAWLRAGKDSELTVNGFALAAHGAARLLLSVSAAVLYTLAGGLALARGWLRSPDPARISRGTLRAESPAARRAANLLAEGRR